MNKFMAFRANFIAKKYESSILKRYERNIRTPWISAAGLRD